MALRSFDIRFENESQEVFDSIRKWADLFENFRIDRLTKYKMSLNIKPVVQQAYMQESTQRSILWHACKHYSMYFGSKRRACRSCNAWHSMFSKWAFTSTGYTIWFVQRLSISSHFHRPQIQNCVIHWTSNETSKSLHWESCTVVFTWAHYCQQ